MRISFVKYFDLEDETKVIELADDQLGTKTIDALYIQVEDIDGEVKIEGKLLNAYGTKQDVGVIKLDTYNVCEKIVLPGIYTLATDGLGELDITATGTANLHVKALA